MKIMGRLYEKLPLKYKLLLTGEKWRVIKLELEYFELQRKLSQIPIEKVRKRYLKSFDPVKHIIHYSKRDIITYMGIEKTHMVLTVKMMLIEDEMIRLGRGRLIYWMREGAPHLLYWGYSKRTMK